MRRLLLLVGLITLLGSPAFAQTSGLINGSAATTAKTLFRPCTNGQVLVKDTTSAYGVSCADAGGAITGADTRVLFFDGTDTPAGDGGLTYNKTTDTLTAGILNAAVTVTGAIPVDSHAILSSYTLNGATDDNPSYGALFRTNTAVADAVIRDTIYGFYSETYHQGSGNLGGFYGYASDVENFGGGTINSMYGSWNYLLSHTASPVVNLYGSYVKANDITEAGAFTTFYGAYVLPPTSGGTTAIDFYAAATGGHATNAYPFWSNDQGVCREKSDNTFNSVYQGIFACYNPQVTQYVPAAANFERGVFGQWESNVWTLTTEAGGTGVLEPMRIGKSGVSVLFTMRTPANAAATCTKDTFTFDTGFFYVCTATDTWKRVAVASW